VRLVKISDEIRESKKRLKVRKKSVKRSGGCDLRGYGRLAPVMSDLKLINLYARESWEEEERDGQRERSRRRNFRRGSERQPRRQKQRHHLLT